MAKPIANRTSPHSPVTRAAIASRSVRAGTGADGGSGPEGGPKEGAGGPSWVKSWTGGSSGAQPGVS
ncbi:hypothetical protein, partial [Actinomadura sp. KC06]|uniref:hypothetical protein n=1 Tax=Actinomadura sp. KC06 TaxID=2530369 RepID=UPI001A9EEB80